jgi:glycosyltransferase involved in cell wall biosynthesis
MIKPKILYLLHNYNNLSGTEIHVKALERLLADCFDIWLVYPQDKCIHVKHREKISIYETENVSFPVTPFRLPKIEKIVIQIFKEINPDICHIHHCMHWPLSIIELSTSLCTRAVITFHDFYTLTPDFTMRHVTDQYDLISAKYAQKIFRQDISEYLLERRRYLQRSISKLHHRIVPSRFLVPLFQQFFSGEYTIIEHGIAPYTVLKKKSSSDHIVNIGYIGGLLPQKGIGTLLRGFPMIRKTRKDVALKVFGSSDVFTLSDEQRQYFEKEGIVFFGAYMQEDLPNIIAEIDIGIIPSEFRETYCLTLSEFWRGGVPVIASKIGALEERIVAGHNGDFFAPGSPEDLSKTVLDILSHNLYKQWEINQPRLESDMALEYKKLYMNILE